MGRESLGGDKVEIGLSELPGDFRIAPRRPFLQQLLERGKSRVKLWKKLAKILGLDYSTLVNIRTGRIKSISLATARTLASIAGVNFEEVEKNCTHTWKVQGKPITIPVYSSPELASLVAHALGDGSISKRNSQVEYKNKNLICIRSVIKSTEKIFGVGVLAKKNEKNVYVVTLPTAVGQVLHIAGALRGNKTKKDFDVPAWIKNGSLEIKKSFLRALFDDEGSIYIGEKNSNIRFFMGKLASRSDSLIEFLTSVRDMLTDFEVNSRDIRLYRTYWVKNQKKVILGFWITGKLNLKVFKEKIGFEHPMKQKKLEVAISSYKHRLHGEEFHYEILRILNEEGPKKTYELARILKTDKTVILRHLHKLETNQRVSFSTYKPRCGPCGFLWQLETNEEEVKRRG